jgi:poly(A) polymerase
MDILGLEPGPQVGRAYQFLMQLRLEKGPLGPDLAADELRRWAAEQHG